MTYEPVLDGSEGRPNPATDAAAPAWPVLARLPWVGEPAAAREGQRARYVEPPTEAAGRRETYATPGLRIAETPAEPSRVFVDRAHAATLSVQLAPLAEPHEASVRLAAAEPWNTDGASRQPRHRIDSGDAWKPDASVSPVKSHLQPLDEPHVLAAHLFQWHAAASPYAGVVLTFFLAFSAGLLYWFTFGRASSAPAPGVPMSAPIWTSESLDPMTTAQDDGQSPGAAKDAAEDVEVFSWSQSERCENAVAAEKPTDEEATKLDTPPLTSELAVDSAVKVDAPAATSVPTTGAYLTTPYASFDFGLTNPAASTPDAFLHSSEEAVAERPADAAVPPPSTR